MSLRAFHVLFISASEARFGYTTAVPITSAPCALPSI